MKSTLITLISLLSLVGVSQSGRLERELDPVSLNAAWLKFKHTHQKYYASKEEEGMRKKIFEGRYRHIVELNAASKDSFKRGVNHMTDLSHAEINELNGVKYSQEAIKHSWRVSDLELPTKFPGSEDQPLPAAVNWTAQPNRVSRVKDQGLCGSCWAFAITGLFEGQIATRSEVSEMVTLSEQQLIDCDRHQSGCHGADPEEALEYALAYGLMREIDYPYLSGYDKSSHECHLDQNLVVGLNLNFSSAGLLKPDESLLQSYVANYGPVMVVLDANLPSFHDYKSGVYYDEACSYENLNHAALIVGYGTDQDHGDYWLIKNSWSEEWGLSGYMKLARNRDNHCGVASMASIII